jgi:hypothetical protein
MSWQLIALCGLAYLWVAIERLRLDPWLALTFLGYAIGNVGLVMKALGK